MTTQTNKDNESLFWTPVWFVLGEVLADSKQTTRKTIAERVMAAIKQNNPGVGSEALISMKLELGSLFDRAADYVVIQEANDQYKNRVRIPWAMDAVVITLSEEPKLVLADYFEVFLVRVAKNYASMSVSYQQSLREKEDAAKKHREEIEKKQRAFILSLK